ncbi:hypothetical protein MBANPS3_000431 [Mucor bainieri]
MKFFKKRLNKRKLTKSLTETALIASPAVHQHDHNKPLPPSPSLISMPPQASTTANSMVSKDVEPTTASDSWLELNLPNDFSSSFDLPQLQQQHHHHHQPSGETTCSNKLEINHGKSPNEEEEEEEESENITETSLLFSYPDNHIDTTTTHAKASNSSRPECVDVVVAAAPPPVVVDLSSSATADAVVDKDESPLQPVEKQGDTLLNDTCCDAMVLVNAKPIPTGDMQQDIKLEERDGLLEIQDDKEEEQIEEATVVGFNGFLAASTSTETASTSTSASAPAPSPWIVEQDTERTIVVERESDTKEMNLPDSSESTEQQQAPQMALPIEVCNTIDHPDGLLVAECPSPTTTATAASSSPSQMIPLVVATEPLSQAVTIEESSLPQELQTEETTCKIAKRKSAVSLIPRKQQQSPNLVSDANATSNKKDARRASSSSFIPVLATRHHQHQQQPHQSAASAAICSMPPVKDAATVLPTVPVTWSPSSSSERNSVSSSSDSASSSCASSSIQRQEKRTSLIAKPSATYQQQQQLIQQQSKIPKAASFGIPPLTAANTELSSKVPATTSQQQHVSRLPTKRNSTLA